MTAVLQPAFRALADPTRRDILHRLGTREMTIAEITEHCAMTRAAVKKHLVVLEEGNLITMRRQGRETLSSLNAPGLKPVTDWLSHFDAFWDDKLSALSRTLSEKDNT